MRDHKVKERLPSSHNTGTTVKWKVGVFASWGCHNKGPQAGWLKTAKMYSLGVLEGRSPKSMCQLAELVLSWRRKEFSPCPLF